jgi:hypothetical protein
MAEHPPAAASAAASMHALVAAVAAAAAGKTVFMLAPGGVAVVMAEVKVPHVEILCDAYLNYFRYI